MNRISPHMHEKQGFCNRAPMATFRCGASKIPTRVDKPARSPHENHPLYLPTPMAYGGGHEVGQINTRTISVGEVYVRAWFCCLS